MCPVDCSQPRCDCPSGHVVHDGQCIPRTSCPAGMHDCLFMVVTSTFASLHLQSTAPPHPGTTSRHARPRAVQPPRPSSVTSSRQHPMEGRSVVLSPRWCRVLCLHAQHVWGAWSTRHAAPSVCPHATILSLAGVLLHVVHPAASVQRVCCCSTVAVSGLRSARLPVCVQFF